MNRWRGRGYRFVTEDIGGMTVWKGFSGAAANWWDPNSEGLCIWAAYAPKGAANFAASLVDLSGSGNNAVDPGGAATPGWDAVNGWTFDGVADYLTTTFVPQNDQSQSALIQFTTKTNTGWLFGSSEGAGQQFGGTSDNGVTSGYNNGNFQTSAPYVQGNFGVAGNQGYRDGIADGGAIGVWTGAAISAVYIGCRNRGGMNLPCAVYIQAFAIYDCTLTAPQVLAVATAMAAL